MVSLSRLATGTPQYHQSQRSQPTGTPYPAVPLASGSLFGRFDTVGPMAERPRSGSGKSQDPAGSDFDWLYGGRRGGGEPGARETPGRAGPDPEPTRVLPTMNRQGSTFRDAGPHQPVSRDRRPQGPRHPDADRATRPPRRPRRRPRFGWLKVVLLLWLVFLVAVPLWAWSQVEKVDADPGGDRPGSQPGNTYLLVGSDSREGLSRKEQLKFGTGKGEGRRTDTIMLLHTGSGPNLLMSIPRDSIVPIPGVGKTKINAAYAYGGPELLVQTIENNTGIRIDDYVEIGFGGFVQVVDAVGGIEICPEQAMNDPQANLKIEAGCQQVDGVTALGYARSRKTSALGDIDRARHQREVVSAIGDKAASPWSVLNPVRYFRLADAGSEALRVGKDTGMISTVRFAWAMTNVGGKEGLTCGVPISDLAVNWDRERAQRLFRLIIEDRTEDVPKRLCRPSGLPPNR
jgi:LCP family protein required for cell wall assembly